MPKWLTSIFSILFLLPSSTPAKDFKVGLLTPGPVSDKGWNAGAYEGLLAIETRLGAKISHVQVKTPAEHEEHFRSYADEGYSLVFGHGFEFQDAARRVGADFPETVFITTSGNTVTQNVGAMVFELEEATYILGFLAGKMSASGVVGMVGGVEIPSVESTFIAFEAGAKAGNSGIRALRTYTGSWEDTALARDATLAQISQGADFIFHNANEGGPGVFQAVSENRSKNVFAFGSNKDQNAEAPDVILASAVIDLPGAFVQLAERVKSGSYKPGVTRFGLASGVISVALNPNLSGRIPDPLRAEMEDLKGRIVSGKLKVPRGNF
ncbi:MAG: BMP family protein [Candidatus Omnitrophica bacterium]|nr:Purine-binding protein [bacterium]NUN95056.1 BMP family protein [Candidatus Omnitrophota bacterium]